MTSLQATVTPLAQDLAASLECLHLRVTLPSLPKSTMLLLSTVYRPPNSTVDFWDQLCNQLESVQPDNSDHIVLGDFNTDVLCCQSHHYRHLQQLCSELCLHNIVMQPTRTPSSTCLDLALLPPSLTFSNLEVISLDDISDHHLVKFNLNSPHCDPPAMQQVRFVRRPPLSGINYERFNNDVQELLDSQPYTESGLDDLTVQLSSTISTVINRHAPLKRVVQPVCPKPKPQPWVNPELQNLLRYRRTLHRQTVKRPADSTLKERYRSVRRQGKILNRKLKSDFFKQRCRDLKHNPRAQWALLNTMSGRATVRKPPKASVTELTDVFAGYVGDASRPGVLSPSLVTDSTGVPLLTKFKPVSEDHVRQLLKSLNGSKSPGSDGIHPSVLKHSHQSVTAYLTEIINDSLANGTVPLMFKKAHVSPVFKSGDPSLAMNYRPISLLPVCSKILEKVVLEQLLSHFRSNDIAHIPDEQFAYRQNHSCEDALTLSVSRWHEALDQDYFCGVVLADMSKAFDRVQHSELVNSLQTCGLRGTVLQWTSDCSCWLQPRPV